MQMEKSLESHIFRVKALVGQATEYGGIAADSAYKLLELDRTLAA
jgi:hypothetical protein